MSSIANAASWPGALTVAVIGGLVVAAVLYLWARARRRLWHVIRFIAKPLTRPTTRILKRAIRAIAIRARNSPESTKSPLIPAIDRVFPRWRTFIEWETTRAHGGTHKRLIDLKRPKKALPCVLLGSAYLDISLRPIYVTGLTRAEHGSLDRIGADCGGSTVWVGRHLRERYGKKSYLLTRIGRGDSFSTLLFKNLLQEQWIKNRHNLKRSRSEGTEQCGISVHLAQYEEPFHTTFTSAGTLRNLGWEPNLGRVQRLTPRGGVLYVSGYFRTNLFETLERSLKQISTRVVVIVDHGQFEPHEKPPAEHALASAFRRGIIDIYVCTFDELKSFAAVACPSMLQTPDAEGFLVEMACSGSLPMITVVRGDFPTAGTGAATRANAYLLRNGELDVFNLHLGGGQFENQPGERSRFTAGLLQKLLQPSAEDIPDHLGPDDESQLVNKILSEAINEAINSWQQKPLPKEVPFVAR